MTKHKPLTPEERHTILSLMLGDRDVHIQAKEILETLEPHPCQSCGYTPTQRLKNKCYPDIIEYNGKPVDCTSIMKKS